MDVLVGLDIGGTNYKIIVIDSDFHVLERAQAPTESGRGYEDVIHDVTRHVDALCGGNRNIKAIGVGLPGIVDAAGNRPVRLSALRWDGQDPAGDLSKRYGAPTFVQNDANLSALGELYFGYGQGCSHLAVITLGTGFGCGVAIKGEILGGYRNLAVEVGSMTVDPYDGDVCLCGKHGCLEAYCSGTAMKEYALRMMRRRENTVLWDYVQGDVEKYDNRMIVQGVRAGDPTCADILNRFTHFFTIAVANVMKLYNPQLILVAGGLSQIDDDLLFEPVMRHVEQYLYHPNFLCSVQRAKHPFDAGVYGACAFAASKIGLERSFNPIGE